MPDLIMDDPFGFNKSIESGEFKLEGVGKLYGQDEETPIDDQVFQFEISIFLLDKIRGRVTLFCEKTNGWVLPGLEEALEGKKDDVFIPHLRLVGEAGGFAIVVEDLRIEDRRMKFGRGLSQTIEARFFEMKLSSVTGKHKRCLMWIPNLRFGGCSFTKYEDGSSTRDKENLDFPSLLGGVKIQFGMLKNSKQILKFLKRTSSSAVTSHCTLEFTEAKSFAEISDFIFDFFPLIGFVTGQRIMPVAYWLKDKDESLIMDLRYVSDYMSVATWCNHSELCNFGRSLQMVAEWFFSQDKDIQKIYKVVFGHYIAANSTEIFSTVVLVSILYGMYISFDDWLDSQARNYPLARCDRKKLRKMLIAFLDETTELTHDMVEEWVNYRMSDFIRKRFRDQIVELFRQNKLACNEKELRIFVKTRNAVVHPDLNEERIDLLDPEVFYSTMYMLRQFEILTLKKMGYTGKFQDRLNIPRNVPFELILDEQRV